jgi:OOP family OmpA-OmpF porin
LWRFPKKLKHWSLTTLRKKLVKIGAKGGVGLDRLTFDLDLSGRHIAEGFTNLAVIVPRLGEARVSVDAEPPAGEIETVPGKLLPDAGGALRKLLGIVRGREHASLLVGDNHNRDENADRTKSDVQSTRSFNKGESRNMKSIRLLASIFALAMLSGCAGLGGVRDIENLRGADPTGDAFTRQLTGEYRQITLFEADEMMDWRDAGRFARKGLRAADGEVVPPEAIEDWDLPEAYVGEMTSARAELVGLLDASARTKHPTLAGTAQGRFDCWIEQQEENHQPDDIAACRNGFQEAMDALKAAMAPKPMPKAEPAPPPPPMAPETFVVFFAFDSTELTAESNTMLDSAMSIAKKMGATDLAVTGHADRAGPEEYNLELSLRRASVVLDALAARGANPDAISLAGRGEAEPAVATEDGVPEPANRRVEIIVLP